MLLCPARPVIRSASRQTLEVPVDAKLFGVRLIDGYDFRFYLDLLFRNIELTDQTFGLHQLKRGPFHDHRIGRFIICHVIACHCLHTFSYFPGISIG